MRDVTPTAAKPRNKSKTIWFNRLADLLQVVTLAQTFVPDFGLSTQTTAYIMFGLAIVTQQGNKYLRRITTGPVT